MKFIFDNFPGALLGTIFSLIGFIYYLLAAEHSVQLTAVTVGIFGISFVVL